MLLGKLTVWCLGAALSALCLLAVAAPVGSKGELEWCAVIAEEMRCQREVVMPDGSRCDLLTDQYAIEVDWAKDKWKEAPAQAVLYAIWTGKEPCVLLLVKDPVGERVDLLRCRLVCERLGIKMMTREVD